MLRNFDGLVDGVQRAARHNLAVVEQPELEPGHDEEGTGTGPTESPEDLVVLLRGCLVERKKKW
jgi:hypothetical protein